MSGASGEHDGSWTIAARGAALLVGMLALAGCDQPRCPTGQTACWRDTCVELSADPSHCGSCDKVCPLHATCDAGECQCPPDQVVCDNRCVDLQTDSEHCGSCTQTCGLGACVGGQCVCTDPATLCLPGSPACVDTRTDPKHCGDCATACPTNGVCTGTPPTCGCPSQAPTLCPTRNLCVDTQTDAQHCGGCDNPCPSNHVCSSGVCVCPPALPTDCSGTCVDTRVDPEHCGDCATACASNGICTGTAPACGCPDAAPTFCSASNLCVNTRTDRNNCGACGTVCGTGRVCTQGRCCGTSQLVCGTSCCNGTACCPGNVCQPAHPNGLGQAYYDCSPLGTPGNPGGYTQQMATGAANAWNASASSQSITCGGGLCLARSTGTQCAVWCHDSLLAGYVYLNAASPSCICPTQGGAGTSSWR